MARRWLTRRQSTGSFRPRGLPFQYYCNRGEDGRSYIGNTPLELVAIQDKVGATGRKRVKCFVFYFKDDDRIVYSKDSFPQRVHAFGYDHMTRRRYLRTFKGPDTAARAAWRQINGYKLVRETPMV